MEELDQLNLEQEPAIEPEPEPVEAIPEPEAPKEEDYWRKQAHIERSKLGRKVKELTENMLTKNDLESFLDKFNNQYGARRSEEDEYDTLPDNPKELRKLIQAELTRANQSSRPEPKPQPDRYEETYVEELHDLMWEIEDTETRNKVNELMTTQGSPYNQRLSNSPESDCGKNFARALAEVMKSKRADKTNPFHGKGAPVPAGVTVPKTQTAPTRKAPKLDDIAAEFARSTGMSEADVLEAMEGEISPGLSTKF